MSRPVSQAEQPRSSERKAQRAEPPRPPALSPTALQRDAEHAGYLRDRRRLEHRSVLRGLILLALAALILSLLRAGSDRAFPAGWWRQW